MSTVLINTQQQEADQIPLPKSAWKSSLFMPLLLFFWVAIYIPGLFRPALLDDADTVHAEAAREMLARHDWATLHANGIRYLEKAPLQYWAVAICYKLFGISEWTTRLPLTVAIFALALVLYKLGSRIYGKEGGFYAALIIITSFGPYMFTRFFIPDLIVGLWLTAGIGFFWMGLNQPRPSRLACWGLAASTALNVLTKGLIGIVFPAAIIGAYLVITRNLRHLRRLRWISSTLVFLGIAAPWHILAALHNPAQGNVKGFLWFYFVNEHFKRYIGTRYPKDYDTVPLLLFWGLLLIWLLPWSAFLHQGIGQIKLRWNTSFDERQRANLLFGTWAAMILIFFSFSTRQEYYVLPALPALALLIGGWMARESQTKNGDTIQRSGRLSAQILFAIGLIVFVASVALFTLSTQPAPGYDIADLLKHDPSRYALSFGHFLDLTPQALGAFRVPLLGTGIALLTGTALNLLFRRKQQFFAANLALAAMMIVMLLCAQQGFIIFEPVMSSRQLAQAIDQHYRPGDVIVVNGKYEQASSVNFYTGKPVHVLNHLDGNLWYGSLFPDAPKVFDTDDSFRRLWTSKERVFLWTEIGSEPTQLMPGISYPIARSGGKVILSNHPNF